MHKMKDLVMECLYGFRRFVKGMLGIPTRYTDTYKFEEKVAIERAILDKEWKQRVECTWAPHCDCPCLADTDQNCYCEDCEKDRREEV